MTASPALRIGRFLAGILAVVVGLGALVGPQRADATTLGAKKPPKRCDQVVHLGDSLTVRHAAFLRQAYRRIGFREPVILAGEGRGVTFKTHGDSSTGLQAAEAARTLAVQKGWRVCWVVALGTNDAAWIDTRSRRVWSIAEMQRLIGPDPVLWVDIWMFNATDRPRYGTDRATAWNALLAARHKARPGFLVLDWSATAKQHPEWYLADHIHYTATGSKARAAAIAAKAATAFS
jgi:lysophospholipase L1-like esterase